MGLESHKFCYPGRCPGPVRLEETLNLRLASECIRGVRVRVIDFFYAGPDDSLTKRRQPAATGSYDNIL